jgi:hypothetical protein
VWRQQGRTEEAAPGHKAVGTREREGQRGSEAMSCVKVCVETAGEDRESSTRPQSSGHKGEGGPTRQRESRTRRREGRRGREHQKSRRKQHQATKQWAQGRGRVNEAGVHTKEAGEHTKEAGEHQGGRGAPKGSTEAGCQGQKTEAAREQRSTYHSYRANIMLWFCKILTLREKQRSNH